MRKLIAPEPINARLRDHELSADDWRHHKPAQLFHTWAERFNVEFKLDLPTPAIRIESVSHSHLGAYREGRNGFGLAHEITMNSRHLDRPLCQQLATLLHELLHAWQFLYGKPGRRNYHNAAFRRKAALYGLLINEQGEHLGILAGRFTELLRKYGVDMAQLPTIDGSPQPVRQRGNSKMKKWRCGCTTVRCAVHLKAQCMKCGLEFAEAWSELRLVDLTH